MLDSKRGIDLRANDACTGAKTSDVAGKQLAALSGDTGLVTLTVGAANLNLSGILDACTADPSNPTNCLTLIAQARAQLSVSCGGVSDDGLLSGLTGLYKQVADRAPNALIVVTGYPNLFEPPAEGDPNAAIINAVNSASAALNCTIEQAVANAKAAGIDIVYVNVTEEFTGHGIGSKKPFINSEGVGAYHPNAAGYRAYAKVIFAAIRTAWSDDTAQVA
ncbi:MAG: GDSL-type esterase/lipase family protein [Actinomycetes bacterium]